MKLPKNLLEVMELFRKDIFLSKTIREISLTLKRPYPKIHAAITELGKRNILAISTVGHSSMCALKLSKEAISLLSFLDAQEAIASRVPNIDKVLEFGEFYDDIIIVAGSYAKGTQSKKSDIDIVIIPKTDAMHKQKALENLTLTFFPPIHPLSFTRQDFIDMLLSKKENFGKEVFRNHLIFSNAERYHLLVKEAIGHGFRSENLS